MSARSRRLLAVTLALNFLLLVPAAAHAYVGPGPGLEFVPYFFSLLAWVGVAIGAVLYWPISALIQRWRGGAPPEQEEAATPAGEERRSGDVP